MGYTKKEGMNKFNGTYTKKATSKPITLESLEDIWKNHEIVPYKFKLTGEIVYITPEMSHFIEEQKKSGILRKARGRYSGKKKNKYL